MPEPDYTPTFAELPTRGQYRRQQIKRRRMTKIENLPLLPANVEVHRAGGTYVCQFCGLRLYDHERFAYPSLMKAVVLGCDGEFYHL